MENGWMEGVGKYEKYMYHYDGTGTGQYSDGVFARWI